MATVVALCVAAPGAQAAAALPNSISLRDLPATVKVDRSFHAQADATLDKRLHKPPRDYLKAALFSRRGTTKCPRAVPMNRRGWDVVVTYDYGQSRSVRVEFGTRLTLKRPGLERFCAYVYVERPGPSILSPSTLLPKASASKLVRAR